MPFLVDKNGPLGRMHLTTVQTGNDDIDFHYNSPTKIMRVLSLNYNGKLFPKTEKFEMKGSGGYKQRCTLESDV